MFGYKKIEPNPNNFFRRLKDLNPLKEMLYKSSDTKALEKKFNGNLIKLPGLLEESRVKNNSSFSQSFPDIKEFPDFLKNYYWLLLVSKIQELINHEKEEKIEREKEQSNKKIKIEINL